MSIVDYLQSVDQRSFDASVLRNKVDEILLLVMVHLADELDTIAASEVNADVLLALKFPFLTILIPTEQLQLLQFFSESEIAKINTATHLAFRGESSKQLPFVLRAFYFYSLFTINVTTS